jgi:flagellar biosynthetic protein FliO
MDAIWKKLLVWWNEASPKKRWLFIALSVGILCTLLFLMVTNSDRSTTGTLLTTTDQMDNAVYYFGIAAKTVGILFLIVGGAIILKRLQKRQQGIHSDRNLAIIESIRLSPKQALHLIRVGDKQYLIGATDQNLNLISEVASRKEEIYASQPLSAGQQSIESFSTELEKQINNIN